MVGFREPLVAEDSADVLAELRLAFGVASNEQVVRKALSLARLAAKYADPSGTVNLLGEDGEHFAVKLRG